MGWGGLVEEIFTKNALEPTYDATAIMKHPCEKHNNAKNARTKRSQRVAPGSNDRSYRGERHRGGRMSGFGWWVEQ